MTRLPDNAHYGQPWRIHELAPEFRLEDVWSLPATGGRDDFPLLVRLLTSPGTAENASTLTRGLFAARRAIGRLLGWDADVDHDTMSLRHRVPSDLTDLTDGRLRPTADSPFLPLYITGDEYAAELTNRTVHGVLHLGWVPDGEGHYRGQLAVLVKPNGLLGSTYLQVIRPFRHAVVYPALIRNVGRKWRAADPSHNAPLTPQ